MPIKLKSEFDNFRANFPNDNIAGFIDDKGAFQWCRKKTRGNLPAAAYVADHLKAAGNNLRKVKIYSSLATDHWIRTYFKDSILSLDEIKETTAQTFDRKNPRTDFRLTLFSGFEQMDAPFPGGGLYDAASTDLALSNGQSAGSFHHAEGQAKGAALSYLLFWSASVGRKLGLG